MKKTPRELATLRQIASVDPASAGPAWRALSEAQTSVAADRTKGMPYTVASAPGATGGKAPGLCAPGAARILLDGELLPCSPDLLDPTGNAEHMSALAAMHGVLLHECGHAVHTPEDREALREEEAPVQECVTLLEEIRMEAQVIRNRPEDQKWLRAATEEIILRDPQIEGEMAAWSSAVLVGGRVPAGTLQEDDLREMREIMKEELGEERLEKIEDICERATKIGDDNLSGLIELGRELSELRPKEPGGGRRRLRKALQKALGEAGEEAAEEGAQELQDLLGEAGAREAIEEALEDAEKSLAGAAAGNSPQKGERLPTAEERRARNELSQRFRRVRWRERTRTERPSDLPPGRLRSREALRRSAEQSEGRMVSARPWRQHKRRMVEMPRLACGILVDTSGSMSSAAHHIAGSLWAIGHAAHENGGRVAAALFGDTAETLWGAEAPPRHVLEITPSGGTQYLPDGIELLEQSLLWKAEEGPRLLVIISDGYWGWDAEDSRAAIEDAQSRGIRVLHVGIGMDPEEHGADHTLRIDDAADLAPVVGEVAVRALRSW